MPQRVRTAVCWPMACRFFDGCTPLPTSLCNNMIPRIAIILILVASAIRETLGGACQNEHVDRIGTRPLLNTHGTGEKG